MKLKVESKALSRAAIAFFLLSILPACQTMQPFYCNATPAHPELVIFGDSYSDTGNIAIKGTVAMPDPFYQQSRFSNGPVAVEILAAHRGVNLQPSLHTVKCHAGYNFAVGGGNIRGAKLQDLKCQVNAYLETIEIIGGVDPSALFVVMMGGNDIRSLKGVANADQTSGEIDQILDHLFVQLERLVAAGAQKFLIANSGNMAKLPSILTEDQSVQDRLEEYSEYYNNGFDTRLASFTGATVVKFDLSTEMDSIIEDGSNLFDNETEGCFDIDKWPLPYHAQCFPGGVNIDKFVFFDSVHASGKSHQMLGDKMDSIAP